MSGDGGARRSIVLRGQCTSESGVALVSKGNAARCIDLQRHRVVMRRLCKVGLGVGKEFHRIAEVRQSKAWCSKGVVRLCNGVARQGEVFLYEAKVKLITVEHGKGIARRGVSLKNDCRH